MPEEPLEGEPAEHEPAEVEDVDAVPGDIIVRRREKLKGRSSRKPQPEQPHAAADDAQQAPAALRDSEMRAQAQRDVARVEEALRRQAHERVLELKKGAGKMMAKRGRAEGKS